MIFVFSFLVGVFCFAVKAFFVSKRKAVIEKREPDVPAAVEQKTDNSPKKMSEIEEHLYKRSFTGLTDAALRVPATIKDACPGVEPMRDAEYITRIRRWPLVNAIPTIDDWVPPRRDSDLSNLRSPISDLKPTTDDWYKITEGPHQVRFLPQSKFNPYVFITRRQHYVNGHGVGGEPIPCRKKLVNGSWVGNCPMCDHHAEISNFYGNYKIIDMYKAEARAIKPVQRYYYNVLAALPDGTKTLKLLSLSALVHDEIFNESGSKNNYEHLTDLRNGRDVIIKKETRAFGNGGYPQFSMKLDKKSTLAISEDSMHRVMANCRDLTKVADQWGVHGEKFEAAIAASKSRLEAAIAASSNKTCERCRMALKKTDSSNLCVHCEGEIWRNTNI